MERADSRHKNPGWNRRPQEEPSEGGLEHAVDRRYDQGIVGWTVEPLRLPRLGVSRVHYPETQEARVLIDEDQSSCKESGEVYRWCHHMMYIVLRLGACLH